MSDKERDIIIWDTIFSFYKETKTKNNREWTLEQLERARKNNQKESYWCRKNGKDQKLFIKPEQRLMARLIKSFLNSSYKKGFTNKINDEKWFDKPDIINFIKTLDENKNKLNIFSKNACSLLETIKLTNYDFKKEQIENLNALCEAVNQRYVSCSKENSRLVSEFEERFYQIMEEPYRMILKMQKILPGYGIALTCDFLKESHLCNIAKPDIHLCQVFSMIDRIPYSEDLILVKRISEFAENVGKKPDPDNFCNSGPYYIDKIIWMLCSRNKKEKKNGKTITIPNFKKELLNRIASKL